MGNNSLTYPTTNPESTGSICFIQEKNVSLADTFKIFQNKSGVLAIWPDGGQAILLQSGPGPEIWNDMTDLFKYYKSLFKFLCFE